MKITGAIVVVTTALAPLVSAVPANLADKRGVSPSAGGSNSLEPRQAGTTEITTCQSKPGSREMSCTRTLGNPAGGGGARKQSQVQPQAKAQALANTTAGGGGSLAAPGQQSNVQALANTAAAAAGGGSLAAPAQQSNVQAKANQSPRPRVIIQANPGTAQQQPPPPQQIQTLRLQPNTTQQIQQPQQQPNTTQLSGQAGTGKA